MSSTPLADEQRVERFLSNDANLVTCVRAEDHDKFVAGVAEYRKWLVERIAWLKYEMDHGGDWKYLNLKREETAYCLEKLNKMVAA